MISLWSLGVILVPVVLAQIETQQPQCLPEADIVFVVDGCGAHAKVFDYIKTFISDTVTYFETIAPKAYQVGVIQYSTTSKSDPGIKLSAFGLERRDELKSAIQALKLVGGEESIDAGLDAARDGLSAENGARTDVPQIVVFIVTGEDENIDEYQSKMDTLSNDFNVLAVGVGKHAHMPYLSKLTGGHLDSLFISKHVKEMADLAEPFHRVFCPCPEDMRMNDKGQCYDPLEGPVCSKMADITFIFDASGSVGPTNYIKMKKFMARVVDRMTTIGPDGVQFSAVRYASRKHTKAFVRFKDFSDKQALEKAILDIPYVQRGGTLTALAMRYTRMKVLTPANGMRPDVPHIVIVITDGRAKDYRLLPMEVAAMEKVSDEILVVGIGVEINHQELTVIAGNNPDRVFLCHDFADMMELLSPLMEKVCECPEGHGVVDGKCIKCPEGSIVVDGSCRPLTTPVPQCNERIDLIFVLDASGSISEAKFEKMKTFVAEVVDKLGDINPENNQVGVVKFADLNTTREAIRLNQFHNEAELENAISKLVYVPKKSTFLGLGLRIARQHGFDHEHGARLSVPGSIVVITDANAKDVPTVEEEIPALRESGLEMYAVGVGSQLIPDQLKKLVFDEVERVYDENGAVALAGVLRKLGEDACLLQRR